jgi:hypothetical protein
MNGLTIAAIVFLVLLVVVWLPLLIISMRKAWKETVSRPARPIPMTKEEAEEIKQIEADYARMQDEVNKTLRNKENNK